MKQNRGERERQKHHADIFGPGGKTGEDTEQDGATGARLTQELDQRGERENEKWCGENVFLEDAGMNGDERHDSRRRLRRKRGKVRHDEPCEPERGEDQHAAGNGGTGATELDEGLQVWRLEREIRGLRDLDHQQRVVVKIMSRPHRIDLGPFVADGAERKVDCLQCCDDR